MKEGRWFSETLIPGLRLALQARTVLRHETTGAHELALIENEVFGRVLLLDGALQVASGDEYMYHEMMAHVPILGHGGARDVLIVGGGDCGLAEEVLKHAALDSVTQVEIDPTVVELAREHFADINAAAFADPRFELVIGDGAAFVRETSRRFDVVLVDSTDPVGPGRVLFSAGFYRAVRRCLRPGGVLVTQNGTPYLQPREFAASLTNLAKVFNEVSCYVLAVPSYCGGHMALGWSGGPSIGPSAESLTERFEAARLQTRYYTPAVHLAAFVLPRYIEDALRTAVGPCSPSEDPPA